MPDNDMFQMPMGVFAEKSVEQAKVAFDTFVKATQEAVNRVQSQAVSAQGGMREMNELALRYTEKNIQNSFEFAQKLMRAKDAKEMAELHAEYIRHQLEALSEQAQELGRSAAKVATPPASS